MNLFRCFEILCNLSIRDMFVISGEPFGFSKHRIDSDFNLFLKHGFVPQYVTMLLEDFDKGLTKTEIDYCCLFNGL